MVGSHNKLYLEGGYIEEEKGVLSSNAHMAKYGATIAQSVLEVGEKKFGWKLTPKQAEQTTELTQAAPSAPHELHNAMSDEIPEVLPLLEVSGTQPNAGVPTPEKPKETAAVTAPHLEEARKIAQQSGLAMATQKATTRDGFPPKGVPEAARVPQDPTHSIA